MKNVFEENMASLGAQHTFNEILQQPEVWKETAELIERDNAGISRFLHNIFEQYPQVNVIFTGAGSSAFIGEALVPALNREDQSSVRFTAIPTTDIVSSPKEYLDPAAPTLLVSFARSGNSPESIAAVNIAEKLIENCFHLAVTCNKNGKLASELFNNKNAEVVLTPEKADDKSLAMTSSFTSMLIAALQIFSALTTEEIITHIGNIGSKTISALLDFVKDIPVEDYNRVVYLGSGELNGFARESSLKMLELSAGKTVAAYDSSLGFRHGPKAFVDDNTLLVLYLSQDAYTRQYDLDILKELCSEKQGHLVVLSGAGEEGLTESSDYYFEIEDDQDNPLKSVHIGLLYTVFAQLLAFTNSVKHGITPDTPSAGGQINRVVKGVAIYDIT